MPHYEDDLGLGPEAVAGAAVEDAAVGELHVVGEPAPDRSGRAEPGLGGRVEQGGLEPDEPVPGRDDPLELGELGGSGRLPGVDGSNGSPGGRLTRAAHDNSLIEAIRDMISQH